MNEKKKKEKNRTSALAVIVLTALRDFYRIPIFKLHEKNFFP